MTPTSNLGYQSFYQAQLTAAISASDLTIPLDVVPTPSEGFLVLESTSATKREIIYYTSKTANSVVCPSGGRGYDGTTAQSHLQNSAVIMAPVAAMFSSMRDLFETTPQGWTPVTQTVSSVTYNGQRSYNLTMSADVSATLSPGMRVRTTRTVTAPTQCTSLNGTTQYYSRASASVTGMTFTDDFTCSAWIKLTSYTAGAIVSRFNLTSGFVFQILATGVVDLIAFNAGGGNYSRVQSYQSIPLNKWVHVSANLDMSAFTTNNDGGATGSCITIDGINVPSTVARAGTNPTSLVQAGNLEIGSYNASTFFPGKLAQVAVFNTKITNATMRSYISQGLTGTETSLISAYSFNNSINDLNTTNANNLTANGSAVATNADSPFSTNSFDVETGTTDYGIIQSVATTTVVVQVPVGCTIPTSGGVSAMSYSTQKVPYGMPVNTDKWVVETLNRAALTITYAAINTWYSGIHRINCPVGQGNLEYAVTFQINSTVSGVRDAFFILNDGAPGIADAVKPLAAALYGATGTQAKGNVGRSTQINISAATDYTFYSYILSATGTETYQVQGAYIRWTPATL